MFSKVTRLLVIVIFNFLILGPGTSAWAYNNRGSRQIHSGFRHVTIQSHSGLNSHFGRGLSRHKSRHGAFNRRGRSFHRRRSHRRHRSFYFGPYHNRGGFYFNYYKVWVPGQWVKTHAGYWIWEPGYWAAIAP